METAKGTSTSIRDGCSTGSLCDVSRLSKLCCFCADQRFFADIYWEYCDGASKRATDRQWRYCASCQKIGSCADAPHDNDDLIRKAAASCETPSERCSAWLNLLRLQFPDEYRELASSTHSQMMQEYRRRDIQPPLGQLPRKTKTHDYLIFRILTHRHHLEFPQP